MQTACERDDCAFAAVALHARRVVPCSTISITCEHLLRHTDYNHTTRRWCRCLDEASNSIWGLGCVPELDGIAQLWANAVSLFVLSGSKSTVGARRARSARGLLGPNLRCCCCGLLQESSDRYVRFRILENVTLLPLVQQIVDLCALAIAAARMARIALHARCLQA